MLGLDRKGIKAVTMPGFGTTDRTYTNAVKMIQCLGADFKEVSIVPSVTQHFKDIGQDMEVQDVTYENGQARERTQILMDIANKENGMVIGTGDLSELALGWATYNGDHMSMYGVNASVPKTLVRFLVRHVADQSPEELKAGYDWAYREFYSWHNILKSSFGHDNLQQRLSHLMYTGGWKKLEPFWNFMIRYGNLNRMLPVLEQLLSHTRRKPLETPMISMPRMLGKVAL